MHELVHGLELLIEGRVLHHCVATYVDHVRAGRCAIFGLRQAGRRCLTVEVALPDLAVVQVRGAFNRMPCEAEQAVLCRWAAREGIEIRSW